MIWLVTDDPAVSDQLGRLIRDRGYFMIPFECADDVPRRLLFRKPALAIIDCSIKGSFDLVAAIRADPRIQAVPLVVFALAPDAEHLREQALVRGANAFVAKGSMDWADLLQEIIRYAGPPSTGSAEQSPMDAP